MHSHPPPDKSNHEAFLRSLIRQQLRLSVSCAAAFVVLLLGLPLVNYLLPDVMSLRVAGFPLSWLVLGIGFFPVVWVIAWVFIRKSIALEEQVVEEVTLTERSAGSPVPRP